MTRFQIAHTREQGQDMIVVPLDHQFEYKTDAEREAFIYAFTVACRSAGLAGTVVPVWEVNGRTRYIAPDPWRPFFRSVTLAAVQLAANRWIEI